MPEKEKKRELIIKLSEFLEKEARDLEVKEVIDVLREMETVIVVSQLREILRPPIERFDLFKYLDSVQK